MSCCLSGYRHLRFLMVIFCLFFAYPLAYAEQDTPKEDQTPLSLESDIMIPDMLWPSVDSDVVDEVPTTALAPPAPLEPPPLKSVRLMLDWYLSPQHAALVIAQTRDLFSAQGLEVELQTPADPAIAIKLLTAGEVDLALTRQPLLHLLAHEDVPITRIATLIETPLNAVIVTGDAQPENATHLAGLHYGYNTREGANLLVPKLVPRSVRQTDTFLAPQSVHFNVVNAFTEESVDAIADGFYHFLPEQLASNGIATHTVRYSELGIPHHDGLIVVANSNSLVKKADTWSRFLVALEEASNWMVENPESAWETLIGAHPILDNATNANAWPDILRRIALSPATLNARRYATFETYLLQQGLIDAELPTSRLAIDPYTL
ncbi:MAG TPA: ABC transporter substrate-binding protein [Halomonas sp.]|nr:ABC transporter substrate-binding protein [Halomonas sp.]